MLSYTSTNRQLETRSEVGLPERPMQLNIMKTKAVQKVLLVCKYVIISWGQKEVLCLKIDGKSNLQRSVGVIYIY